MDNYFVDTQYILHSNVHFALTIIQTDDPISAISILYNASNRDEDPEFFSTDPDPAQLKKKIRIRIRLRIRPEIEMKKKIYKIRYYNPSFYA